MFFFKLIRWPNLLIVLITQCLIYFNLLLPAFKRYHIQPQLDHIQFIIFVLVTLLITACGYIINDLVDQKTDAINKPEKKIIGPRISEQIASWLYITLAILGFFLALYLAFATDNLEWIFLYPLATIFLIVYSTHLKQRPLVGNLIVAFLCSGVTGVIWIAEMESLVTLADKLPVLTNKILTILAWYMVFAFFATLFREIIKDLQDIEGDKAAGCKTIPIVWGIQKAKLLALGTGGLLMILIGLQFFVFNNVFERSILIYSLLTIFIPLTVSFQRIVVASKAKEYWWISQFIKFIIISGVLLLLFIRF